MVKIYNKRSGGEGAQRYIATDCRKVTSRNCCRQRLRDFA